MDKKEILKLIDKKVNLTNSFRCRKSVEQDCILTPINGNEDKCGYTKRNGIYQKINRIIRVRV